MLGSFIKNYFKNYAIRKLRSFMMSLKNLFTLILFFLFFQLAASSFGQVTEDDYQAVISQADAYFISGDYINAKASYQYASRLKPSEQYPKDRLQETINKIRDKMVVVEQFSAIISEADKYFKAGNYEQAKLKYTEAKKVMPEDSYPDKQIAEITRIADEASAKQNEYDGAIANGEKFIKFRKYDLAKAEFEKALAVNPEDTYSRDKISELTILIEETNRAKAAYAETIAGADRLYNLKYYENARKEYEKALNAKPDEDYPAARIKEIDKVLVQKNEFDRLVQLADDAYGNKDMETAKANYQAALKIYPDENYPKTMIEKANTGLMNNTGSKDELYQKSIAGADNFLLAKDYTNALNEYENASSIKPAEKYPIQKIAEVKGLMEKISGTELEFNQSVQKGEQFFAQKDYNSARAEFTKANQLKPDESYPKVKLQEIGKLLKVQDENQESFNLSVSKADEFYNKKDYDNAIIEYQKALVIIPGEKKVSDRIAEINSLKSNLAKKDNQLSQLLTEADNLFLKASYADAKLKYNEILAIEPEQETAKARIAEIGLLQTAQRENENNYNKAIAAADIYYKNKEFQNAQKEYQKASSIKPSEPYPADKLAELNTLLQGQAAQQNSYDQLIAAADKLFNDGKFEQAKIEYQKALDMKPGEKYPSDKIKEINEILAARALALNEYNKVIASADQFLIAGDLEKAKVDYTAASSMRPAEQYPKDKLAEITVLMTTASEKNKEYDAAIKEADGLFNLQQYVEANLVYMKAANIKLKEQYPKDKMAEIDQIILAQKALEADYNQYVSAGDRMLESKEYDKARERYNLAIAIKPDEEYPRDKLREIDAIVLSQELAVQDAYNQFITDGDDLFKIKQYDQAKLKYQNAQKYKPDELYPAQKLGEIERLVSDLETLQVNYSKLIGEADVHFKAKEFQEAKTKYIQASALFPEESYPTSKIAEINVYFKSEQQKMQQAYDKSIADADKFFGSGIYDQALEGYRTAKIMIPDETYPDEMINRIMNILDANAVRNLVTSAATIANNEEKRLTFEPVLISDRKGNMIFIKARNTTDTECKVVLSYGKGSTKNGGFILPIPANQDSKDFIIPVGKQYTWFSQDNDWITLVPQGGTVELITMKISKGN
jgi:tetratricopeptide (TPR) repeat protein